MLGLDGAVTVRPQALGCDRSVCALAPSHSLCPESTVLAVPLTRLSPAPGQPVPSSVPSPGPFPCHSLEQLTLWLWAWCPLQWRRTLAGGFGGGARV